MLLKIEKFERFARQHGFQSGGSLLRDLGCGEHAYSRYRKGGKVNSDVVMELYCRYGDEVLDAIDFEDNV
mgnify:CR=1 FL=1